MKHRLKVCALIFRYLHCVWCGRRLWLRSSSSSTAVVCSIAEVCLWGHRCSCLLMKRRISMPFSPEDCYSHNASELFEKILHTADCRLSAAVKSHLFVHEDNPPALFFSLSEDRRLEAPQTVLGLSYPGLQRALPFAPLCQVCPQ